MQNEILEKKQIETKTQKEIKKKTITIIGIVAVFVALLVFAIIVFKTPVKVSFSAPGKLGFSIDPVVVDKDGKIAVPDSKLTDQKHYNFLGWYDNQEGKGDPIDLANTVFEESTTIYAIWDVIEYKVTYDLAGGAFEAGSFVPSFYTISHDALTKSDKEHNNSWQFNAVELEKFIQEPGLRVATPTKFASEFSHWEILVDGVVQTGITINTVRLDPLGDITLRAVWK